MRLDVQRTGIYTVVRMRDSYIGSVHSVSKPFVFPPNTVKVLQRDATRLSFASDQFLPSFRTFAYNVGSILLVFALARESKLVLRFSVWDLVDAKPLVRGPEEAGQMSLNVFNVIQARSQWVIDIDNNNLPICLLLVEKGHDT